LQLGHRQFSLYYCSIRLEEYYQDMETVGIRNEISIRDLQAAKHGPSHWIAMPDHELATHELQIPKAAL